MLNGTNIDDFGDYRPGLEAASKFPQAEKMLGRMEDIYSVLVTVDFPDAITSGLRRNTDMVRGVLERTRGDVTTAVRQEAMKVALQQFERRIGMNE